MHAFRLGPWFIDPGGHSARGERDEVRLTPAEVRLLWALYERRDAGWTSRALLLREVFGYAPGVRSRAVDSAWRRLRQKLCPEPTRPRWLVSRRGAGLALRGVVPVSEEAVDIPALRVAYLVGGKAEIRPHRDRVRRDLVAIVQQHPVEGCLAAQVLDIPIREIVAAAEISLADDPDDPDRIGIAARLYEVSGHDVQRGEVLLAQAESVMHRSWIARFAWLNRACKSATMSLDELRSYRDALPYDVWVGALVGLAHSCKDPDIRGFLGSEAAECRRRGWSYVAMGLEALAGILALRAGRDIEAYRILRDLPFEQLPAMAQLHRVGAAWAVGAHDQAWRLTMVVVDQHPDSPRQHAAALSVASALAWMLGRPDAASWAERAVTRPHGGNGLGALDLAHGVLARTRGARVPIAVPDRPRAHLVGRMLGWLAHHDATAVPQAG